MLLTASHVLTKREDRQLFLEVPDRFEPITIHDSVVAHDLSTDAAVIRLANASFEWGLEFLNLEIQRAPEIEAGDIEVYMGMGFPVRETSYEADTGTVGLKLVNYRAFEYPEAYDALGLPRSRFVVIRFDRKLAYHKGFVRPMKLPHGMSGGGLWRFWGPRTEAPTVARGGFAGILTEYRETPVKCMISVGLSPLQDLASDLIRRSH